MDKQLRLFPTPRLTRKQLRDLVKSRLYDFHFRQAQRDERRQARNERLRREQ